MNVISQRQGQFCTIVVDNLLYITRQLYQLWTVHIYPLQNQIFITSLSQGEICMNIITVNNTSHQTRRNLKKQTWPINTVTHAIN